MRHPRPCVLAARPALGSPSSLPTCNVLLLCPSMVSSGLSPSLRLCPASRDTGLSLTIYQLLP